MQKQINFNNQNTQLNSKDIASQPTNIKKQRKVNYWIIITVILFVLLIVGTVIFFIKNKENKNTKIIEVSTKATKELCESSGGKWNSGDCSSAGCLEGFCTCQETRTNEFPNQQKITNLKLKHKLSTDEDLQIYATSGVARGFDTG